MLPLIVIRIAACYSLLSKREMGWIFLFSILSRQREKTLATISLRTIAQAEKLILHGGGVYVTVPANGWIYRAS